MSLSLSLGPLFNGSYDVVFVVTKLKAISF